MRVDSHAHGNVSDLTIASEEYINQCRERGVEKIVLISRPEGVFEAKEKCGDFVIPVAVISMDRAGAKEVASYIEDGCKGIKMIRPKLPYSDDRYYHIYETISQLDAVAVFHTGYLARSSEPDYVTDINHMRPAHLDTIVRRFPKLKVLMAHFGNPWWEEAWKVAWANPNIYADLSGGTAYRRSLSMWRETFAPDGKLHAESFSKLCFGSDVRYFGQNFGFQPYVEFYEKLYDAVNAPDDLRERVNRRNVLSLFGVE
jgi:predicted TIM-barrel fold metal-dependent hydrolase